MDEELRKYRDGLVDTLRFLHESYDKLLVTLSGGALGLSIAFLKDVIELDKVQFGSLLFYAWLAFIVSLGAVLGRLMFGIEAYRRAINQVDEGTIYDQKAGGQYSGVSRVMHVIAAVTLIVGLLILAAFAYINVGGANG